MSCRTEKMGNKTVKWKYGEKLLVQAVMDDELHDMISENYYVGSYEFSETVADRNGEKVSQHTKHAKVSALPYGTIFAGKHRCAEMFRNADPTQISFMTFKTRSTDGSQPS